MTDQQPTDNTPILEVAGMTKRFPGVLANDNVNLTLRRGEILALLGENGAGKSTLMNIIYGLYHPDEGTVRIKGQEVRFSSPREAIRSGIGMVHQHFQLVNVMTVAENVVLGEEDTIAYQGGDSPGLKLALQWLPSIVIFVFSLILGFALADVKYITGGAVIGAILAVLVAIPPAARLLWGVGWRVGLGVLAVVIASNVAMITRVGLTAVALRHEVSIVDEKKPDEIETDDGLTYTVKRAVIETARIDFDWPKQYRTADDNGTGIDGVLLAAKAEIEPFRDNGIPGWLIDAIDDWPPYAEAFSVALLLFLAGWHSAASWRGHHPTPRRLREYEIALIGAILALNGLLAWTNLDGVNLAAQVAMFVPPGIGLALISWRLIQRRYLDEPDQIMGVSPLDSVIDAFLALLNNLTQIRNMDRAAQQVRDLSQKYGLEVDPHVVIEKLPVGAQQRVEIIKALYRQADILILDEPTAVLTPQEGRELFKIMRELASQGVSIIFITHKLKEVFEVATHIVVMRGGRVVGTTTPDEATETSLAAMMVGREVILQVEKDAARPAQPVLEVAALSAFNDRGAQALDNVGFTVHAGEVLGIAGVQGNGQTELVEVLTGLRESTGGSVRLMGAELQPDKQPEGGLWPRVFALVADTIALLALTFFVAAFVWYFTDDSLDTASTATQIAAAALVYVVLDALYFLGLWLVGGGSFGMSLFALQVVDERDQKPGAIKLVQRYLIFLVLRVPLFVPWALALRQAAGRDPRRTWFDRWLGLRVIRFERITPRRIKDTGTSHVPEDRQRRGMVKDYSVADNLVLNDFYRRPFAAEPDMLEFPGAALRYVVLVGLIVAGLTALALAVWNNAIWGALLDAYNVPEAMREVGDRVDSSQRAALQYPYIIGVFALLLAELVFGAIAHTITRRILGTAQVRTAVGQLNRRIRGMIWRATGHDGSAPEPSGGLTRDQQAIHQNAVDLIAQFDIRTPSADTSGGSLSGGNQQKMIVAREFSRKPRLLIAAQPTRGIDVGSIEFIHRQIIDQRDAGAAVLLVSAELDEIMALSDRIAVLYKGAVIDTLPADTATREQLGLLMAGIKNGGDQNGGHTMEMVPAAG